MLAMVGKDYATSPSILGSINGGRVFADDYACVTARLFLRGITEFLPANAGLVHQSTLGNGKRCHALVVRTGGGGVMLASAGARSVACRARGGRCAGGDGDRGCLDAELELAGGEFVEGALVLKKHDLAIALAA